MFLAGRANQTQAWHGEQAGPSVLEEFVLIGGDALHRNLLHIIERHAETNSIGDVARSCFEPAGRRLVNSFLEGDVHDHIAAALPWRHVLEHVELAQPTFI